MATSSGVGVSNGQRWINARRFLLSNLRDLGMGKSFLDEAILHEAQVLVDEFKSKAGGHVRLPNYTNITVVNIIWQMVASCRFNLHDDEVIKFMKIFSTIHDNLMLLCLPEIFPWVKYILPDFVYRKLLKLDAFEEVTEASVKVMKRTVDSHRANLDFSNPRDVIDKYLVEMSKKTDIAEYFSEPDLMKIIMDLYGAGFETTSKMLQWILLYMAKYPEVQARAQQQIDDVVSRDTLPTNQHKSRLPYVEAIIHEVLRIVSFAPLGVMHSTNRDVHLGGYLLPKDTLVFGVIAACHEDPQHWADPHEFQPDRFLDAEGRFVFQREGFLPFSVGRRSCLGESLAKMELLLFTSALLQNFNFASPEGGEVDLRPKPVALINNPREQDLLITVRK
ncbi:cytochrome P450 2L1-like isoform X2 [Panulirus ornatus]|uniref:cytochrome P450 2L1-like isoform X2 n=1 Tax=Panulirus ornatus TaxID=150431 RepID=UPI003A884BE6